MDNTNDQHLMHIYSILDIMLSALHALSHFLPLGPYEISTTFTPI